jgi:hypothetical protein
MLKLRQFDLQLAFGTGCALGKDVENQTGSVDHTTFEFALKIPFLGRRQFMVENHQIGRASSQHCGNLLNFSLAGKRFGIGTLPPAKNFANNNASRRLSEQTYLFQLILEIGLTEVELNDHRALDGGWSFSHEVFWEGEATARRVDGPWSGSLLFRRLFLLEINRASWHYRRDGMLVHHLGYRILEQYDVLIEGFDLALQFDPVDQVNRNGNVLPTESVEEGVL